MPEEILSKKTRSHADINQPGVEVSGVDPRLGILDRLEIRSNIDSDCLQLLLDEQRDPFKRRIRIPAREGQFLNRRCVWLVTEVRQSIRLHPMFWPDRPIGSAGVSFEDLR